MRQREKKISAEHVNKRARIDQDSEAIGEHRSEKLCVDFREVRQSLLPFFIATALIAKQVLSPNASMAPNRLVPDFSSFKKTDQKRTRHIKDVGRLLSG